MPSNFELCISFLILREREREGNTFLFVFPPNVHLIPKEEQKAKYFETRYSRISMQVFKASKNYWNLEVNLEITVNIAFCFSSSCFDNSTFCFSTTNNSPSLLHKTQ